MISLDPVHRDVLKLTRTICYDGIPATRVAVPHPTDPWLSEWIPNEVGYRFRLAHGVPEPIVRACLLSLSRDQAQERWGIRSFDPDAIPRYLSDRGLLSVHTTSNRPIRAAFANPWNDEEIFCEIVMNEEKSGKCYLWTTTERRLALATDGHELVLPVSYRNFRLTERAHELLDAEKENSDQAKKGLKSEPGCVSMPSDQLEAIPIEHPQNATPSKRSRKGRNLETDPKEDQKIAAAWANGHFKTLAEFGREKGLSESAVRQALDRDRKRQKALEK